ncbi:MAG: hypothetical protein DHS20C19_10520 [Acidimicrobiales bacterium]|nr:MAG: hypothetical protein DHS20C19_10520 [Acidimicrobiales bacterium]
MSQPLVSRQGRGHRVRRPSGEPPPLPRELNKVAVGWLAGFVFWALIWTWVFVNDDAAIWITERDLELMRPIVDNRRSWLTPTMQALNEIGSHWATPAIGWTVVVGGLLARRVRHVLLMLVSMAAVAVVVVLVTNVEIAGSRIARPRPLGMTKIGDWDGFAQPSRVSGLLAVVAVSAGLTLLPIGRWRRLWWVLVAATFAAFSYAQIYTGVEHPTDIFAGTTVGVAVTLVLFRLVAPEAVFPITRHEGNSAHLDITDIRGEAIRRGIERQLGLQVLEIEPVGLEGSAGSTPLRITVEPTEGEPSELFAKLYARSHLRSDRSYKLFRTLVYGRLEDETHFTSVRRLVQHEDYMLHVMHRAGIPSAEPYGVVEITPDREYLLVSEFLHDAVEIGDADLSPEMLDEALDIIAQLWRAGFAHRDIKPANLMIADGHVRVIDVAFAQIRPSPWRQAVDLANMMLVLALRTSPEQVYLAAINHFSPEEIAEAFAASRGVTLPSALRGDVKRDGRALVARFRELAPVRPRVSIQRWSWRRLGLTMWVVLVAVALASLVLGNLSTVGLTASAEAPPAAVIAPYCEGDTSALIGAQSVPTATVIPCLGALPPGWDVESVRVNQDGTVVHFDSDRAGENAGVLHFRQTCDSSDTVSVPSADERIQRRDRVTRLEPDFVASWYYLVEGACWWWDFDLSDGASATFAVQIDEILNWVGRDALNADLSRSFIDEDL